MKKYFIILLLGCIQLCYAQINVGFSGGKGSYTFSKPFKTIKDIPRFSEWDSLPNGKWRQLYEGGQLALEYTMKKYLLNGPVKGYYPDGALRYEFTMNGNYIDGEFREYYPSGQLWRKFMYFEGFMNGPWEMFYEDGKQKAKGDHKEDKKIGVLTHWYPNGNKKEERTFVLDTVKGPSVFWYENGNKMMEGWQHPIDVKVGKWTFWWDTGIKQKESEFVGNIEKVHNAWDKQGAQIIINGDGKFTSYNASGAKLVEGWYKNSLQHGKWYYWDERNPKMEPRIYTFIEGIKQ